MANRYRYYLYRQNMLGYSDKGNILVVFVLNGLVGFWVVCLQLCGRSVPALQDLQDVGGWLWHSAYW